jgi:hypothetical protein
MRFIRVVYSHATEVVLLLKLSENEVFFRHKSAEKFMGFAQPTRTGRKKYITFWAIYLKELYSSRAQCEIKKEKTMTK